MTLDEAIEHCRKKENCSACGQEHKQLRLWLEELRERRGKMSLLIKGMDMPKHAVRNGTDDTMYRSCVLIHPDGTAELVVDLEFADKFNFEHCLKRFPLVEVPTPHGDLIDRDELASKLIPVKDAQSRIGQTFMEWLIALIKEKPPTIIEAEE